MPPKVPVITPTTVITLGATTLGGDTSIQDDNL